jgi:hypothetical protein
MRRVPASHSSTSALVLSPLMYLVSVPGHSATICQSPSVIRSILKVTRGDLPMPLNMRPSGWVASPAICLIQTDLPGARRSQKRGAGAFVQRTHRHSFALATTPSENVTTLCGTGDRAQQENGDSRVRNDGRRRNEPIGQHGIPWHRAASAVLRPRQVRVRLM